MNDNIQDSTRRTVDTLLRNFIQDDAARAAAVCLVAALKTVEKVYGATALDNDTKLGVLRLVTDMVLELPANDFWLAHGGYVMPIYTTAVLAWLDGPVYAQRIGSGKTTEAMDAAMKLEVSRSAIAEVAVAIMHKAEGVVFARRNSMALRDAMMELQL